MLIYNDTENPNDAILGMEPDDLSGRYIAMPTDYLWDPNLGMAHLPPRTAALLCMSLCIILDPTGTGNYRQMTTSYDTISTLLCLPPPLRAATGGDG